MSTLTAPIPDFNDDILTLTLLSTYMQLPQTTCGALIMWGSCFLDMLKSDIGYAGYRCPSAVALSRLGLFDASFSAKT